MSVEQGVSGGSMWCVLLCETDWRIATKEEIAAHQKNLEARRRALKIAAVENANNAALASTAIAQHMDKNSAAPTLTAAAIAQNFPQ